MAELTPERLEELRREREVVMAQARADVFDVFKRHRLSPEEGEKVIGQVLEAMNYGRALMDAGLIKVRGRGGAGVDAAHQRRRN